VAFFNLCHGALVLLALGGLIQLGVASGHADGPVSHQFFHHLQGRACIQQLGGKGMTEGRWGVGLHDASVMSISIHQALNGAHAQRRAGREGTWKHVQRRRRLQLPPLAENFGDIGGIIDHPIHLPLAVVDADSTTGIVNIRPREHADFPNSEPTAQHEQKHGVVSHRVNDLKELHDIIFRHRTGERGGDQHLVSTALNGLSGEIPCSCRKAKKRCRAFRILLSVEGAKPWR
jgi:hypothetical protein